MKLRLAETSIDEFKNIEAEKVFRNRIKRVVGTSISKLSSNVSKIQDCVRSILEILHNESGGPSKAKEQFVNNVVALRLMDEADVRTRGQTSGRAAWPVAYVATQIFAKHPCVEELFFGYLSEACPFLVSGVSQDGQRPQEEYGDFVERMLGYHRLYLAILIVQDELAAVWRWLARTLNQAPVAITPTLLHSVLEMAGSACQRRYKRQFRKLVTYIQKEYQPQLHALQEHASGEELERLRAGRARLRALVEDIDGSARAPSPEGRDINVIREQELRENL